jgi:hypothetical protein
MNDLNICKFLARWGLHMNLNQSCGIDASEFNFVQLWFKIYT